VLASNPQIARRRHLAELTRSVFFRFLRTHNHQLSLRAKLLSVIDFAEISSVDGWPGAFWFTFQSQACGFFSHSAWLDFDSIFSVHAPL